MVGHALAGDDPVVGLKLFEQGLVDLALGGVREARSFVGVIVIQLAHGLGG